MLMTFPCGAVLAQAVLIGSALTDGTQLVYESAGVVQAPWVYDSVRVVERAGFDRCVVVTRRSQAARESCARGDTLFQRSGAATYAPVRPIGPNMQLEVRTTAGNVMVYETGDVTPCRIASGLHVACLPTTILTRGQDGLVTQRLRERYAPALLTAPWGVFEEPVSAGGWRSVREFSLREVRRVERPSPRGAATPVHTHGVKAR